MFGVIREESGQDLAEYCLITALIALLGLFIFYRVSGGITDLWSTANTSLAPAGNTGLGAGSASANHP